MRRLFQNAKEEELKYFRKNGFYPIMHIIALKQELVDREPWVAGAVMDLFEEAKKIYSQYYDDPNWSQLAWGRHFYEEQRELLGRTRGRRAEQEQGEPGAIYRILSGPGPDRQEVEVDDLFAETVLNT